jgi:hypothetical protein
VLTIIPHFLGPILHWPVSAEHNGGYGFWSGIGSGSPILLAIVVFWRHHNCHEHKCWRMSWHPDAEGHPICRVHHSDHPAIGLRARLARFGTEGS